VKGFVACFFKNTSPSRHFVPSYSTNVNVDTLSCIFNPFRTGSPLCHE